MASAKMLTGALGVLFACGSASAGLFQEIQTKNFSGVLSPFGPITLTFDQFDDSDPDVMLTSVELEFTATISANVTAENNNDQPAPEFGIQLSGFVNVDGPAPSPGQLSGSATLDAQATSPGVGGSDGVPGSGPDFFDFGVIEDTATGKDTIDMDFGAFTGMGTVDAAVFGQGGFTVTGASSAQIQVSNFQVEGEVTIIYSFIPTPGAAGLFGAAGLMMARRRR